MPHVVVAYVVGHAIATYAPQMPDDKSQPAYERLSAAEFPFVRDAARLLPTRDLEKEFEFGLDAMLTGLEARLGV